MWGDLALACLASASAVRLHLECLGTDLTDRHPQRMLYSAQGMLTGVTYEGF